MQICDELDPLLRLAAECEPFGRAAPATAAPPRPEVNRVRTQLVFEQVPPAAPRPAPLPSHPPNPPRPLYPLSGRAAASTDFMDGGESTTSTNSSSSPTVVDSGRSSSSRDSRDTLTALPGKLGEFGRRPASPAESQLVVEEDDLMSVASEAIDPWASQVTFVSYNMYKRPSCNTSH